ncbi:hypothetical protein LSUB1_G004728 [Lachnellula subtilissima]|uniref:DUF5672 domain-containing protein n=1 Tax=Lachnellula subtilissima TaxID=602034 RepID=A0A8H8UD25_9HELO|nr:hypothetical protein LSUB1_G004728 [Lachnellula subtilissima]
MSHPPSSALQNVAYPYRNVVVSPEKKKPPAVLLIKAGVVLLVIYFLLSVFLPSIPIWTPLNLSSLHANKTNTFSNVAAIIEDRPLSNLAPLILHFSSVLGPDWPIVLFTSTGSTLLNQSVAFQRAVDEGRISIRALPEDTNFENHAAVSELLTAPWFWEQLAPAGHVLLFQADSIICANSELRMEDFLRYDFVGAPVDVPVGGTAGHGEGYNGGLSLRNRSMVLDVVKQYNWKGEMESGAISQEGCVTKAPCLKFEDQWFYHKMKDIPGVSLPSKEVASTFAVETVWYDTPLGYHQVERWNANRMDKVAQWCPEYKMATTDLLVKHGKAKGS